MNNEITVVFKINERWEEKCFENKDTHTLSTIRYAQDSDV